MATLNAIGGTVAIDMTSNGTVNHSSQSAPTNATQYSWLTTSGITIHAFSFEADITFNATSPLGGTIDALQAVNSYTIGGLLGGDLVSMASSSENYWRPILLAETTIFASSVAATPFTNDFTGAGDFVNVNAGEILSGSADLFEGSASGSGAFDRQSFYGDANFVQITGRLTGGQDAINMREDGEISGDANGVFGRLTGGDDTIVLDGTSITDGATRVAGDAVFLSDLEQAVKPIVTGGDDTITVLRYLGGIISGDILDAFNAHLGTSTGGADLIDASANTTGILAVGDVANLGDHTVRGGKDTLIGSATAANFLSGDAYQLGSSAQLQAGADTLTGGNADDVLYGDYVSLTAGSTVVINASFTGDDKIYGGGGNDLIQGQVGDDTIDGGMGDDTLDGGSQTAGVGDIVAFNTLNVAVSVDLAAGFAFGQGVDTLTFFESIRGSNQSDSLSGDTGANQIEGLDGNDRIIGRSGNDTLIGGKGDDTIKGGDGNDIITGSQNADKLFGQSGNDTFNYDATNESGLTTATRDIIHGFVQGNDLIDVTDIDAQATLAGNQNFAFIGTAAFSAEGQVRFDTLGGQTFIEFNTSGASGAEMGIQLVGVFALTGADFVL
jgi:hypothetical protein